MKPQLIFFLWVLSLVGVANPDQAEVRLMFKNIKMLSWPELPTPVKLKTEKKYYISSAGVANPRWTKNYAPLPPRGQHWRDLSEVYSWKYFFRDSVYEIIFE